MDAVREALLKNAINRITVSRCAGRGQGQELDIYRGIEVAPDLIAKTHLYIACNDEYVNKCISAITSRAHDEEEKIGDGKIFVTNLEQCIRIRTGESGKAAV